MIFFLTSTRFRKIILFGVLLAAVSFFASCEKNVKSPASLKIGVIADDLLDGRYHSLNGVLLGLERLEAEGGLVLNERKVPVELVAERITFNPEEAVAAARKLINREQVHAVIGPQYSGDAIPAGAIAEMTRVPMISAMSTNPATTAGRNFVFRMSFHDRAQGIAMARLAAGDLAATRAAILYNAADPYSKGLAEYFRDAFSRDGRVVSFESYITGDDNFRRQLEAIQRSEPDVLYLPGFLEDIVSITAQVKNVASELILLGSDGWNQIEAPLVPELDGAYYSSHWSPEMASPGSRDFAERYEQRFGLKPISTAALSYDAFRVVIEAVRFGKNLQPGIIRDSLVGMPPYPGIAGVIDFTGSGTPNKNVLVLQIRKGENRLFRVVPSRSNVKTEIIQ